jgi:hypothetical protein
MDLRYNERAWIWLVWLMTGCGGKLLWKRSHKLSW